MKDLLIVGGGTAGLTAAIYAGRAGLSCTVFEGNTPGGKIVSSPEIANYPALPKVSGADYAMALLEQAQSFGTELIYENVISAKLDESTKILSTASGDYEGRAVIIANGASRKKLGAGGEDEFSGRGVSYCATCDGNFFRGRAVAVVGGGDTAFEDVAYLLGICERVYLVNRTDSFNAATVLKESVLKNPKITVLNNSEIIGIQGDLAVTSVTVKNRESKELTEIPLSAVFIAVGIAPDNAIFGSKIALDERGYIISGEDCTTAVDGVFVAGDTRKKELRQLVTAASDGAVAATAAFRYIRKNFKDR